LNKSGKGKPADKNPNESIVRGFGLLCAFACLPLNTSSENLQKFLEEIDRESDDGYIFRNLWIFLFGCTSNTVRNCICF
jgi:hypothetical protein